MEPLFGGTHGWERHCYGPVSRLLNSQCLIACVRAHKMTTGGGALVLLSWEDVKLNPWKIIVGYFVLF